MDLTQLVAAAKSIYEKTFAIGRSLSGTQTASFVRLSVASKDRITGFLTTPERTTLRSDVPIVRTFLSEREMVMGVFSPDDFKVYFNGYIPPDKEVIVVIGGEDHVIVEMKEFTTLERCDLVLRRKVVGS